MGNYENVVFEAGDMVICRNNAPTITLAYRLIADRTPVFVKGRDIGRNLISVIEKAKAVDVPDLAREMKDWLRIQTQVILEENPDNEDAVQRITDRYDSIMVFITHNSDGEVASVVADIEELFSTRTKDSDDEYLMKGKVVLSSIHKSKGLEAQRVYILDRFLIGSRAAQGSWQMEQENNLAYVATTRAKEFLHYIITPKKYSIRGR
jgi:superfamily I DNA/RNA helicase